MGFAHGAPSTVSRALAQLEAICRANALRLRIQSYEAHFAIYMHQNGICRFVAYSVKGTFDYTNVLLYEYNIYMLYMVKYSLLVVKYYHITLMLSLERVEDIASSVHCIFVFISKHHTRTRRADNFQNVLKYKLTEFVELN